MGTGWIHEYAMEDSSVPTRAIQDDAVTSAKIADNTIEVGNLNAALLKYLLSVARVDYAHVDYCKVG